MSDPKFTPGPWKWLHYPDGRKLLAAPSQAVVHCPDAPIGMDEADAHLIAAAPDLYAACKMVASFAQSWQPLSPGDIKVMTDALAKAEGRSSCSYGDPSCPCQDGDPCHYEDTADTTAMTPACSPKAERDAAVWQTCRWTVEAPYGDYECHATACGNRFCLDENTKIANGDILFCCYCGGRLIEVTPEIDWSEEEDE